tara:strand:+ start:2599 stop:2934 length:336 start_codon:yes stop_codon:yes gene_type:complete
VLTDQRLGTIGRLCALTNPVRYARLIDTQALFATSRNRVKETKTFDKTTIAPFAAVSDHQMKKWTPFGAGSREANLNHETYTSTSDCTYDPRTNARHEHATETQAGKSRIL